MTGSGFSTEAGLPVPMTKSPRFHSFLRVGEQPVHGGPRLVAPPDRVQAGREELVLARQAVLLNL